MQDSGWLVLLLVGEWLLRLVMVGVVLLRRNARSETSVAWIAVIMAVPIAGVILFVLLGLTHLGQRRLRRYRSIVETLESPEVKPPYPSAARDADLTGDGRHLAAVAESFGASPVLSGNQLLLMGDTDVVIQRMAEDIDEAREHCHLLVYIYLDDHSGRRIADALMRAARRGVTCRLLLDSLGSRSFLRSDTCRRLRAAGVHVVEAMPANLLRALFSRIDVRNHRKLMIVDGRIGYTGSQNIANADFAPKRRYAPWVDAMVRMEGPVVRELQTLFVEDWYLDTNESLAPLLAYTPPSRDHGSAVQVYATGPLLPPGATRTLLQAAMQMAREELVLTTPYFVPDESLVTSLATGARRGTVIRLIVPKRNDSLLVSLASRAYYTSLLEAGVEIVEFQNGLLHAKTLTIDRKLAIVTSANVDRRSFDLNFEAGIVVYDSDFASQLRFLQTSYIEQSIPVDPRRWSRRSLHTRLFENSAALLAPLL